MSILQQHVEIQRLLTLKRDHELKRMGKMFATNNNKYFYDTGTGKVLLLDQDSYEIMDALYNRSEIKSIDDLKELRGGRAIEEFGLAVAQEKLFRAFKPHRLYTIGHYEDLERQVNSEFRQLILELTGRCNLRCGYCIYNEDCDLNRNFNDEDMTVEVAKAAIDYTAQHTKEKAAVTFYGGEPLLRFDLLKWSIEYSLEIMSGKDLSFSLTTNLTLVTKEIAEFLAAVPNLSVVCSLDGPEYVQNSYRKYSNGYGSFSKAICGLELLCEAFKNSKNVLSINAVFAPPYSQQKLNDINSFFQNLTFLPSGIDINITYAAKGSIPDTKLNTEELPEEEQYMVNPLWDWMTAQTEQHPSIREKGNSIYAALVEKILIDVENRFVSDEPAEFYPFNGCCVPGARRLYVNTKGDLYVCERVGNSPSIGNIFDGIDFERIRKFYVEDYSGGTIEKCKNCWAIRLCSTCYIDSYTESGFHPENKRKQCSSQRKSIVEDLVFYHAVRETSPEKLGFLKNARVF
ncbi:radical SAM protein [Paenibacillus albidus]|uniref:radical SAM/SPASM domain-containing protein n=1 Tax=Paenibacillus albidus TaxID=2041023 RepID=UPI001BE58953|nr:radical SAM protein [Paenibacillus albidus]MBT2291987.1 radical SAM protein [Paenibacillus albidus]